MKNWLLLGAVCALVGCGHSALENQTPSTVTANASGVYPLMVRLDMRNGNVEEDSVHARVVVDGKARSMKPDGIPGEFIYEYRMSKGRNAISYYFDVDYTEWRSDVQKRKNAKTPVRELSLSNRYVLAMDSSRGMPGARITIIGRGFSQSDEVFLGDVPAETAFESATGLQFFVPTLPSGREYPVRIVDETGTISAGKFYVDDGTITVTPRAVELTAGEDLTISVVLSAPAPDGGLEVSISSNIPDAISVDEICIPSGRTSAAATVEGIQPAQGIIYLSADGFQTLSIPVRIRP